MLIRNWLEMLIQTWTFSRRLPSRSRSRRNSFVIPSIVQRLENRQLLSATAAGSEFRINSTTAGNQGSFRWLPQTVAADAAGDFVVTWQSAGGQDGSGDGIYAQRYNAAGVAQGSEFRVNTTTAGNQIYSSVAMDAGGDFVITWSSPDGSQNGIYAQRYNASGVAQGSEFRVNTTTTGNQFGSIVSMDTAGDFVVSWTSFDGQDGSGYGSYAQRYNAAGVAQGSEFRVNTTTTNNQSATGVAMAPTGDFVITWGSDGQDGSGLGIYAQRYNAVGVAQGSEFRVNTFTAGVQYNSEVAVAANGDFVISWASRDGQDGSGSGIYAQRYNAAGVAQGSEFRVNTTTSGNQDNAKVSMDSAGNFVVTWTSTGQDGSGDGIYAQQYNAAGVAQGSEFRVNTFTTGDQRMPTVAMDAAGDFIIAWTDYSGEDGSGYGVYAQRYQQSTGLVYWTDRTDGTIKVGDLQTSVISTVASGISPSVWGVAVDASKGNLYFTKGGNDSDSNAGVGRIGVNGAGMTTLTTSNSAVRQIELDLAGGKMYWAAEGGINNSDGDSIYRANLDGTGQQTLLTGLYNPRGMALDLSAGKIYFSQWDPTASTGMIMRVNLDGTNLQTVVTGEASSMWSMDLDPINQKLYWATNDTHLVRQSNLDGTNVKTILSGLSFNIFDVKVDPTKGYLYVAGGPIIRAGLDGSNPTNLFTANATNIFVVNDPNDTPTNVSLSASTVAENQAIGTTVGTFSTTDPDAGNTFGYTLVSGTGSTDNASFTIDASGNLKTAASFNFESKSSYSIRVRSTDQGTLFFEKTFTITVTNVNEAPVLVGTSTLAYAKNQVATAINTAITVNDVDNTTLSTAWVSLTNYLASNDVLGFVANTTTMGNITGSFNTSTGVMTLTSISSTATLAQFQAALRAVTYFNKSGNNANVAARYVAYQVSDGTLTSNTITSKIVIS